MAKIKRATRQYLRLLQALAAISAIIAASWTLFLENYTKTFFAPPIPTMTCKELHANDADSPVCDGVELRMLGDGRPGLFGIDAPETEHAKCPSEKALGETAAGIVNKLLPDLRRIEVAGFDRYQRPLVRFRLNNGRLISDILLERGYAVIWTPAYNDRWCDQIGIRDK